MNRYLLLAIFIISAAAAEESKLRTSETAGELRMKSGGKVAYRVVTKLQFLSDDLIKQRARGQRVFGGGGRGGKSESSQVVYSMLVTLAGRKIRVPADAFRDISEPNIPKSLRILDTPGGIEITFTGSSGEFYYTCRLVLKDSSIHKRIIDEPLNPRFRNIELLLNQ